MHRLVPLWLLCMFSIASWAGEVSHDSLRQIWTLRSGGNAYSLSTRDGILSLHAFAPSNKLDTFEGSHPGDKPIYFDLSGLAENEPLSADAFEIVSTEATTEQRGIGVLTVKLRHRLLPLELILKYRAWGDTGVFTRDMTFVNRGQKPLSLASTPSLSLMLPSGEYTLRYLYGGWGEERQLTERKVGAGSFTIRS